MWGGNFDLWSGIESIFIPISGRTETTVYGLWFLPCLYLIEIIVAVSDWLNAQKKKWGWLFAGFVTALCVVAYRFTGIASVISILPIGLIFLLLGKQIKPRLYNIDKHKYALLALGLLLYTSAVYLNATFFSKGLDLSSMSLGCVPLYLTSCLGGTLSVVAFSYIVSGKILMGVGSNSLYYYGLHYCVIGIVSKMAGGVCCMLITLLLTTPLVYGFKYIRKRTRLL